MNDNFFIDLAAAGLRMPIGTDLVLHEKPDAKLIREDGRRLGEVVAEAARRYRTPVAVPLMDLTIEKTTILQRLGIPAEKIDSFHFTDPLKEDSLQALCQRLDEPATGRWKTTVDAVAYVAQQSDLLPVGMSIGPFSLMTKLIADPITAVFMAGSGVTAAEDPEVAAVEQALDLGLRMILRSITTQLEAGAKAIIVCEPAANQVYFSPKQLAEGTDIFERYVMTPNRHLQSLLADAGAKLIFHDCGELTESMVRQFTTLEPALLSFGSSRVLWDDAALVPNHIVLFGNLPTKKFYSDDAITPAAVVAMSRELLTKMRATGHPFILASECDVLSVPGCERTIQDKVTAFMNCPP
ncbi:MAG: uroporphyrinogen decarboxylase family protein [Verrucomicrobiota bacterium]